MNNNQQNQYPNQPVQNRNMNIKMNNWSLRKKILALGAVVLLIVGVVVTIILVQRQQELRSRAEKATVLSLTPSTQNAKVGDRVGVDVNINPGVNQVNYVQFKINFDPTRFESTTTEFELDSSSPLVIIKDLERGEGQLTITLGAGSDPTKVIQEIATLGKVTLHVGVENETLESELIVGATQLTFDEAGTQVRSVGSGDAFNENVLLNTVSAQIVIGEGERVCKPNIATCEWDPAPNATSYHYVITRQDRVGTVIAEDDTSATSVEFEVDTTPGTLYRYSCAVTAKNECGEANPVSGETDCAVPSVTPTPIVTSTPTPTPTEEATPTPTEPEEEVTPTDAPEEEATPTPTEIAEVTQPPAQGGSESVITATPTPTIPPPGNPVVYGGIIGGVLFLIGGLALLLL